MTHFRIALLLLAVFASPFVVTAAAEEGPVVIYVARKVVTMERLPAAAVAVAGGRVVAVGTLDDVQQATRARKTTIDRTFADKILMPAFVIDDLDAVVMTPADVVKTGRTHWDAGRQILVEGDADAALDALAAL